MKFISRKMSNNYLFTLLLLLSSFQYSNAQCGSCTNPTGIVTVGFGESICYDANTTITSLDVFFDGMVTICDGVILTISGTTQLSGTAQIIMNNCSEIHQTGSFTCSSNNALVYAGDNTCDARLTIEAASALCASLTDNSHIHFCNLNGSPISGSPGLATIGCGLELPIELTDFKAIAQDDNTILVEWLTASEFNNDFFTVERSNDNLNWTSVAKIDGARNSIQTIHYSVVDQFPYFNTSYYRLKQTDFDGKYSYSSTVSVNLNENQSSVIIYPNPANEFFNISGNENELSELSIYNIFGQNITSSVSIQTITERTKKIDLTNLSKGVYIVKTKSTNNTILKK